MGTILNCSWSGPECRPVKSQYYRFINSKPLYYVYNVFIYGSTKVLYEIERRNVTISLGGC